MSRGEICARHYQTAEPNRIRWEQGRFSEIHAEPAVAWGSEWIAPTLFDAQVNGYGGVDFQQDNLESAQLGRAIHQIRQAGCGQFMLTLITDAWSNLLSRLAHYRQLRAESHELRDAIAGWHIEGPFLSSEPGFCGAHNPAQMLDPKPEHLRALRDLTEDDLVLLTLAPERQGGCAAIALATSLGMRVNLGHTNADAHCLRDAWQAGARGFTHLGNGCPRELDRHDNILWRALDGPAWRVSLIPDGIHVSAPLFRSMHRLLPPESIYYVSDAMAAAGAGAGCYSLGRLRVEVGHDEIVRQPGRANFAGSALQPWQGIARAASMLGVSWAEVWERFSEKPRQHLGLPAGLAVGQPADFCVVKTEGNQPVSLELFVAGEPVSTLKFTPGS